MPKQKIGNHYYPMTMDLEQWGITNFNSNYNHCVIINTEDSIVYNIEILNNQ